MTTCGFEGHNSSTNKHVKLSLFISKLHLFQYFIIVRPVMHATIRNRLFKSKKTQKSVWWTQWQNASKHFDHLAYSYYVEHYKNSSELVFNRAKYYFSKQISVQYVIKRHTIKLHLHLDFTKVQTGLFRTTACTYPCALQFCFATFTFTPSVKRTCNNFHASIWNWWERY